MEKTIKNCKEMMDILISSKKTSEFNELNVVGDSDARHNIIFNLSNHQDWETDCSISSSTNIWYLFKSKDGKYEVSINDGEDSFYNDIVLTINY
jgi:hypothetical protein